MTEEDLARLRRALQSARMRCADMADSEQLMGFAESARTYKAMADEFQALIHWLTAPRKRLTGFL